MEIKLLIFSYLLQLVLSFLMLLGISKVNKYFSNQVGFAFLGLLTMKIAIIYGFANYYLFKETENIENNKLNFLFIFLLFLGVEVYYTVKLLNKKSVA